MLNETINKSVGSSWKIQVERRDFSWGCHQRNNISIGGKMNKSIHVQTNTATLVIYDLMSLKHRIDNDADWWSLPEVEIEEINKGNVLFLNLGEDGTYKIHIKNNVDEYVGALFLNVPSGKVFIGAGEDVTGGDLEPDDSDAISGEFIILEPGSYKVKFKKQGSDVLISFTKATFIENSLEEGVYL